MIKKIFINQNQKLETTESLFKKIKSLCSLLNATVQVNISMGSLVPDLILRRKSRHSSGLRSPSRLMKLLVPSEAWSCFVEWKGDRCLPIQRVQEKTQVRAGRRAPPAADICPNMSSLFIKRSCENKIVFITITSLRDQGSLWFMINNNNIINRKCILYFYKIRRNLIKTLKNINICDYLLSYKIGISSEQRNFIILTHICKLR